MKAEKKSLSKKTLRRGESFTGLPDDAIELDDFVSTLDHSGSLKLILAKPVKKSASKK